MTLLDGLKLEWFKFSKNRVVVVCLLILMLLLPGIGSVILSISTSPPLPDSSTMLQFPEVWRWFAYISNWIVFFLLGFVFVYIVATEYDNKTLRQSVINGLTRREVFSHKVTFIVVLSLAYTLYYTITSLSFGFFLTSGELNLWDNSEHILYVFLVCLGYGSIGMILAMLFRKTSLSIILYLIYGMFLENVIRHLIHSNLLFNKSMHYYPVNVLEDLTPLPIPEYLSENVGGSVTGQTQVSLLLNQNEALIGALIFIILFIFFSYRLFMRKDL